MFHSKFDMGDLAVQVIQEVVQFFQCVRPYHHDVIQEPHPG